MLEIDDDQQQICSLYLRRSLTTFLLRKVILMQGTQVLISTIDYNEYVGRIGVGKVDNGSIKCKSGMLFIVNHHDPDKCQQGQDQQAL